MTAMTENLALSGILQRRGINLSIADVNTLRRAQLTLNRWACLECGDGNNYASWSIERDEKTEVPYMVTYPHDGKPRRHRIPDREKGALRRVAEICQRENLHYYHQTDPRGCSLYIHTEPMSDFNYTSGVPVCL